MNWLSRLTSSGFRDVERKGRSLPATASIAAVTASSSMLEQFAVLGRSKREHLDFFLTVAVVFSAITALSRSPYDLRHRDAALKAARRALALWHPRGSAGLDDCAGFVERNVETLVTLPDYQAEPSLALSDAIGLWVLTNLLDHVPTTDDELASVRPIGRWCGWALQNFWE